MIPIRKILWVFFTVLLLAFACAKKPRNNPLDPKGEDYQNPELIVLSDIKDKDTLNTDSVFFSWSETQSDMSEFQFRLNIGAVKGAWSAWADIDQFSAGFLDDGDYALEIQARFPGGKDVAYQKVNFTISALTTPAVFIYPQRLERTRDTVVVSIKTRALPTAHLMHLVVKGAAVDSVVQKFDPSNPSPAYLDKPTGTIDIIALGTPSIAGDAWVADLYFHTTSDTVHLSIDTCIVRENNSTLPLGQIRGGVIIKN